MNPENQVSQPQQMSAPIPVLPQMEHPAHPVTPNPMEITPAPMPKKGVSKVGVFLVVLVLFFLVGGTGVMASMIAYDKINVGNSSVQSAIRNMVLSLPFAPKTAAYVIEKSVMATSTVQTTTIDASFALTSPSLLTVTGSSSLDATLKGSIDRTDPTNVKSDVSLQAGSLLSADIKSLDKKVYVKVNTFPTALVSSIIPVTEETLNNAFSDWIVWESNALDSEARNLVEQNSQNGNTSLAQGMMDMLSNKALMDKMILTTEDMDGMSVYKLHPTVDAEFVNAYVNQFGTAEDKQKMATNTWLESLKDFNFDVFISKDTYLVHKFSLSFSSTQNSSLLSPVLSMVPGSTEGSIQVAAVMKFSDYNKKLSVTAPETSKSWQELFADFSGAMQSTESGTINDPLSAINPSKQFAQANDAKRKADLLAITNAIYQYAADNNGYLPSIGTKSFPSVETCIGTASTCFNLAASGSTKGTIVPKYIAVMPKDPSKGTDADTKYVVFMDTTGRLQASAESEVDPSQPIVVTR